MAADPEDPPVPKKPFNYVALVGVVFLLIAAIALVNSLRSEDSGTVGIGQVGIGEKIAPFAVPIATSDLDGDANIDPDAACSVEDPDAMRICDYFDRPLVVSFWFSKGSSACIEEQDIYEKVAARFGKRVGFISINVRDDRDRVRDLIREHGWKVPVGYDRDGAVSNIYRVGVCPTFLFVEPGGTLKKAAIRHQTLAQLDTQVRSLIDGAKVKANQTRP